MHTANPIWMTPRSRESLERELCALLALPRNAGADDIVDAWLTRKERIRHIHELLSRADHAIDPADDGIAEPGMVLTVRFDDSGDTETFLLGTRGTADAELEVYTVNSPLGGALHGATPGEKRSYPLPGGGIQSVTLVAATPFGAHQAAGAGSPRG